MKLGRFDYVPFPKSWIVWFGSIQAFDWSALDGTTVEPMLEGTTCTDCVLKLFLGVPTVSPQSFGWIEHV